MVEHTVDFRFLRSTLIIMLFMIPWLVSCAGQETPQGSTLTTTISGPAELWVADGIIKDTEYENNVQYRDFQIFWRSDSQYIYIGIKAATTGFVSVGIQPGSRMKNADIILGYVKGEETIISDMFSIGDFGPHPLDVELGGTNDIVEYGGSEDNNFTTIEFKRALDTGDKYDITLSQGLNKIIWSFGSSDEISQQHTIRGYGEINL